MHDDARTNLAIALSAAEEGAVMANYMEAVEFIHDKNNGMKISGAVLRDAVTGVEHTIYAKSILFCGGPYTDNIRKLESKNGNTSSIIRGPSLTYLLTYLLTHSLTHLLTHLLTHYRLLTHLLTYSLTH